MVYLRKDPHLTIDDMGTEEYFQVVRALIGYSEAWQGNRITEENIRSLGEIEVGIENGVMKILTRSNNSGGQILTLIDPEELNSKLGNTNSSFTPEDKLDISPEALAYLKRHSNDLRPIGMVTLGSLEGYVCFWNYLMKLNSIKDLRRFEVIESIRTKKASIPVSIIFRYQEKKEKHEEQEDKLQRGDKIPRIPFAFVRSLVLWQARAIAAEKVRKVSSEGPGGKGKAGYFPTISRLGKISLFENSNR